MKHQILSLREFFDKEKEEYAITDSRHFKKGWGFEDYKALLAAPEKILAGNKIPSTERYNLFYTVALCSEKKREFVSQSVLMFDIDKMGLKDETFDPKYIEVVCEALGIQPKETAVIFSGNGLHFAIALAKPITESVYFDANRRHYTALCLRIDAALARSGLPGKADPAVFDPRRIMRFPGTENRKEGKPPRAARVVSPKLVPIDFDLPARSGLPVVEAADQINPSHLKKIPTDGKAVLAGCDFLKRMKEKPSEVSEAEWYAGLSVLARIDRKTAHDYSAFDPRYSHAETESKIDQALESSGPRTCKGIAKLWSGCSKCPNFEKVISPIMIRGSDFIKTEGTGFHATHVDQNGNIKVGKPQYEDLRKFFERKHPYVVLGNSGICLVYNGTFWEEFPDLKLASFAQEHFNPPADNKMVAEFKQLVCRTNLRDPEWFIATTEQKLNLRNGVLDLVKGTIEEHASGFGFRYCLEYDYDPAAKAPVFEKFISEVMGGDKEMVRLLLEYAGYCFSGDKDCWAEQALILTGEGSNGKSTFMNVLKALAGKENYSSLTLKSIQSEVHRHALVGKLFNLGEETPTDAMLDGSIFKNLVSGGDHPVKILYKQPYEIANTTKFMFACNELPRSRDVSRGMLRRMLIAPFNQSFEGKAKDKTLKRRMLSELPGILNVVLGAYKETLERGEFLMPEATVKEALQYQLDIDTVKRWVADCVKIDEKFTDSSLATPVDTLYSAYRIYCEDKGEYAHPESVFVRRLRPVLPNYNDRKRQVKHKGRRVRAYAGLQLLSDGQQF